MYLSIGANQNGEPAALRAVVSAIDETVSARAIAHIPGAPIIIVRSLYALNSAARLASSAAEGPVTL